MIQHPSSLWLLLIILPVVVVLVKNFHRGRKDLFRIGGEWRKHQLYDVYLVKGFFSSLVFIFFVLFTVLSLAGFSGSRRKIVDLPKKADIVFAVDISRSMLCDDTPPSRLSRSADVVKSIIGSFPNQRYGLVVFKGRGVKLVPVTEDSDAVLLSLLYLSPGMFTSKGTDIESGLASAVESFPSGEEKRKIIILFSDGENLSGDIERALKRIKDAGIEIIVFGSGTEEGKILKDSNGRTVIGKDGRAVVTRLNRSQLKYISSSLNGAYFEASSPGSLSAALDTLSSSLSSSKALTVQEDSYTFYLFFSVLSLFLYVAIRIFPWKNVF